MPKFKPGIAWLAAWLTLFGCSRLPPRTEEQHKLSWQQRQDKLQQLTSYTAYGTLAYKAPDARSVYVIFLLKKRAADHFYWRLNSVLGQTLLSFESQNGRVKLRDQKGGTHVGHNGTLLIKQLLGAQVPLNQLYNWIVGLPSASDEKIVLDKSQRLQSLEGLVSKQKVQVNYLSHHEKYALVLPRKIQILLAQQEINLKIGKWDLN